MYLKKQLRTKRVTIRDGGWGRGRTKGNVRREKKENTAKLEEHEIAKEEFKAPSGHDTQTHVLSHSHISYRQMRIKFIRHTGACIHTHRRTQRTEPRKTYLNRN